MKNHRIKKAIETATLNEAMELLRSSCDGFKSTSRFQEINLDGWTDADFRRKLIIKLSDLLFKTKAVAEILAISAFELSTDEENLVKYKQELNNIRERMR